MNIDMDDSRIQSIAQLAQFLNGAPQLVVSLKHAVIEEKYRFIDRTVDRFGYSKLKRKDRHTVYRYLRKVTGYQKAQLLRLSDRATQEILRREYELFNKKEYQTIARVSHGHISNLRHHPFYVNAYVNHTKARLVPIGSTQPPENYGRPGSIWGGTGSQRDTYPTNAA